MIKLNVGCGPAPLPGWLNIDNSPSVRIPARLGPVLQRVRLIKPEQARVVATRNVRAGTATNLPVADKSCDVIYTSHMLEHLTRGQARMFIGEAERALSHEGVLRIVVPDLRRYVQRYLHTSDANEFISGLRMANEESGWQAHFAGFRGHRWMYDEDSIRALVESFAFVDVATVPSGITRIAEPGALNLSEREQDSLYLEATRA